MLLSGRRETTQATYPWRARWKRRFGFSATVLPPTRSSRGNGNTDSHTANKSYLDDPPFQGLDAYRARAQDEYWRALQGYD